MKRHATELPDVWVLEPDVYEDSRGSFFESYNHKKFCELMDIDVQFVQDNHSISSKHVLRGLHYQVEHPQGKLLRVVKGAVFDVAVDIRKSSPTFGQWTGRLLTAENHLQLWIPGEFAHGFLVLSDTAEVLYKTTDYYSPQHERCLLWNDPGVNIDWQGVTDPVLNDRDASAPTLDKADLFA